MLTIYEQVQAAIDAAEADLGGAVSTESAAEAARMSVRSLHRYFPALTGYSFGTYVRRRRLSVAADELITTERGILPIALDWGYESNEAFTRAFKKEFGVAPSEFRSGGGPAWRVGRIDLVGEVTMGVLTRDLETMHAVTFDGFEPEPERSAFAAMEEWVADHGDLLGRHRVFGHNIDRTGAIAHDPHNVGYRVFVTIPVGADAGRATTQIDAGRFVVTGIEGSFEEDPSGAWITLGWERLNEMIRRSGYEVHPSLRWYEEVLEPVEPGNARFDLYLEIA